MGSVPDPRRTADAGVRGCPVDRLQIHGAGWDAAFAKLEDVPSKPRAGDLRHRSVCGSDPDLWAIVRVSGSGPRPAATAVVRGDATSDRRVAGPTDHRGLPLGLSAGLPGAR